MKSLDLMAEVATIKKLCTDKVRDIEADAMLSDAAKSRKTEEVLDHYRKELEVLHQSVDEAFSADGEKYGKRKRSSDLLGERFDRALRMLAVIGRKKLPPALSGEIMQEFSSDYDALSLLQQQAELVGNYEFAADLEEAKQDLPHPADFSLLADRAFYETTDLNQPTDLIYWKNTLEAAETAATEPQDGETQTE